MSNLPLDETKTCPHCGCVMNRKEGVFFYRGHYAAGWVCSLDKCNALEAVAGEEIPGLEGRGI